MITCYCYAVLPAAPTLTGPTNLTPRQSGIWFCTSVNGYPAGIMSMRNQETNTTFMNEFTSTNVLRLAEKSFVVTGTLRWSPTLLTNKSVICCDVMHPTTLGNVAQTICLKISGFRKYFSFL